MKTKEDRLGNERKIPESIEDVEILKKEVEIGKEKVRASIKKINEERGSLREQTLMLLNLRKRNEATELMVEEILSKNTIYTIRDDSFSEVWIYRDGIYVPAGKSFIKGIIRKVLDKAYTTHFCNEVIAKIEADTYINEKDFFNSSEIEEIAVQNGVLNLKTKEISDFTPSKIFFNKLPVIHNPAARCPAIEAHFRTVFKTHEDLPVIQELIGSLLFKDYFTEKAAMFVGDCPKRDGRNGKSKTLLLIKNFLGPENCVGIPVQNLDTDQYALSELLNKMANLAGDLSKTALKFSGNFKISTGRDFVSAPRKYKPLVHFINYAKHIFACNQLPITYDKTQAFWNRWILFEFVYMFVDKKEYDALPEVERVNYRIKDPDIINKLTTPEELSGLLNWAMIGLDRLRKNKGRFSTSKSIEEIKLYWIRKSCSVDSFLKECVKLDFEEKITKKEFRKAYMEYCKKWVLKPDGDRTVKNAILEFGGWEGTKVEEGTQDRCWCGIDITNITDKQQFLPYSEKKNSVYRGNSPIICNTCNGNNDIIHMIIQDLPEIPLPSGCIPATLSGGSIVLEPENMQFVEVLRQDGYIGSVF